MFEKLTVEFEANGSDVAALFGAKQIARATDFEVAHGNLETAAERGILFDGGDAFADIGHETAVARQEQVGIGLVFVAAHATAQLVEVAQAEAVGAIYDDGIGIRDIEAAFDDGRGEEDIGFAIDESGHDFFEFVAIHLAMTDNDARLGNEAAQLDRKSVV